MPITEIHECECEDCQDKEKEHPNRALHQQMNVLVSRLGEQQRRWYVALAVQSYRPRRRCFDVEDHGPRREDDPTRTSGDGGGACGPTGEACPAAGRRSAFDRKKEPATEGAIRESVEERTGVTR